MRNGDENGSESRGNDGEVLCETNSTGTPLDQHEVELLKQPRLSSKVVSFEPQGKIGWRGTIGFH